jgi:hypothetical protein
MSEDRVRQIEELVRRVELIPDAEARRTALELMAAVLDLHGTGLERMMEIVHDQGDAGKITIRRLAADQVVASLLVLHGLHPDDIETRVQHVLGKVHGNAELLGVFEGSVRIRLTGSGCGLKEAVEAAVRDGVPDAAEIVIEESAASSGFVPLAALGMALPERV